MIRVYLDWNIITSLKRGEPEKQSFQSLHELLFRNKDKILIPYTSAHLSDLITSYKHSERGKTETLADLIYLEKLTENLCIVYDYKTKSTNPGCNDIQEYFQVLLDSEKLIEEGVEGLFSSLKGTPCEPLLKSYLNLLKQIPTGIDPTSFENVSPKFKMFTKQFQSTIEGNSLYHLLNDSLKLIKEFSSNPGLYRSSRNATLEQLKLNHDYSKSENPIAEISKNLEASALKKSFKEFADSSLRNSTGKQDPSRFDIFTNRFLMMDFLGFQKDREFKNLIQDSFHTYYAAHCDFFITDDKHTYEKAKAIYKEFHIETIVCNSGEFNAKFFGKIVLSGTQGKSILTIVAEIIKSSFVITRHDNEFNPVDIYKIESTALNYFNRLQLTHNVDGSKTIYIYKNQTYNYSTFIFFKEIEAVINQLSREFGKDIYGNGQNLTETEREEILNNKWNGRIWKLETALVTLKMREQPFGLSLSFHLSKETLRFNSGSQTQNATSLRNNQCSKHLLSR